MGAVEDAKAAEADQIRAALDPNRPRVVGRVGTTQGRVLEVVLAMHGHVHLVHLLDPAVPHSGGTLAVMNTDQAAELADALARAANRLR